MTATALKLGFQPMAALSYLFMRAESRGEGLSPDETRTLLELRARYRQLLKLGDDDRELLLFRLAKVAPPSTRALRRPGESHLDVEVTES
ncbi:MAG: hypothetical protein FJY37_07960 [Betaproteobacteria bacterium]|nr:hypothetical protein [Betaproteobacteria bacterium]